MASRKPRFAAALVVVAITAACSGDAPAPVRRSERPGAVSALVLYDTTGEFGATGELYAISAANLAGHFGSVETKPVVDYEPGDVARHTATIYLGSTYDEPLPEAFLDDVLASTRPVIWAYSNIWQLVERAEDFVEAYGFRPWTYDTESRISSVTYKGRRLTRLVTEPEGGIMRYDALDGRRVTVLAEAVREDETTFPWAVRSGTLTYIGEIPFTFTSESDRTLVFSDLLFDALAPGTTERHRALVRLEDIAPNTSPALLREFADFLYARGVPFAFGVSPVFNDPLGDSTEDGAPTRYSLSEREKVVDAIRYMQRKGGVLIGHGYTHQWSNRRNPYTGMTGDDYEFYRVTENPDHSLEYVGPLPEDSYDWAAGRMAAMNREFVAAGLEAPRIFEFPHYTASVQAYRAAADSFEARWDRGIYFSGVLRGSSVDHSRYIGQFFPYVVRDVYGHTVLPENLGNPAQSWFGYDPRTEIEIVRDARKNLVIRDGFASFFYHPFLGTEGLGRIIDGIKALGYEFVSPESLL